MKTKTAFFFFLMIQMITLLSCVNRESNHNQTQNCDARKLWQNKVRYIGNNSNVSNLVNLILKNRYSHYKIELQTTNEPYGLIITFDKLTQDLSEIDFKKEAILLLSLINNAQYVRFEYNGYDFQLSIEEANKIVGFNLKELYSSEINFLQYVNE